MAKNKLKIDQKFRKLIPPPAEDEVNALHKSLEDHGCLDPLVIWKEKGILLDGHNRYDFCTKNGIDFATVELSFNCDIDARVWVRNNQMGRRNLLPAQRIDLQLANDADLKKKGREKRNSTLKQGTSRSLKNEKTGSTHNTEAQIAQAAKVSKGQVAQAEQIIKHDKEHGTNFWDQAKHGNITIGGAYKKIKTAEAKAAAIAKLEDTATKAAKTIQGVYDVIVMDPPWSMQKIEREVAPNQAAFDYPTMTENELSVLTIPSADDCHFWLWTTHKFLPMAFRLLTQWKFKYVCCFTWHKPGGFQPFGLPQYNCEFSLYARKGVPQFTQTKAFNVCFNAPRGKHSEKPEEFYSMVRRVTAGRRLDMFNRRPIKGFDTWGKEAQ
jgi:N6-adenosine-specific RNA methylase IME4